MYTRISHYIFKYKYGVKVNDPYLNLTFIVKDVLHVQSRQRKLNLEMCSILQINYMKLYTYESCVNDYIFI